ncbi:MAG: polyribonucleotide nucleotidyltransferase [Oscillospiraceae bacterium]|nr:polyribonucleotide nucleotidyltransferase [Oscillospiraceae bacterium]
MNYKKFSTNFAGREITVEVGKTSCLANGSCWIRYGDTVVMTHATMSAKPREGVDFFPLSVDYEEKLYAAGKIPGSFFKREGKPTNHAILTSRLIDRPIRPFFPKEMRNDVSVVSTVLSTDIDNSPEVCAMFGAAVALSTSDIPWNGPIVGIAIGIVDGDIVLNPNQEQREKSEIDLTIAASYEKVVMIEAGAKEVEEKRVMECIAAGHEEIKKMIEFINKIVLECGKEKVIYEAVELPVDLLDSIKNDCFEDIKIALDTDDKNKRDEKMQPIIDKMHEKYDEQYPDNIQLIDECIYKLQKTIVRNWLLKDKKRVDGRKMDEMRPLSCNVALLPRVHGSGLFTRGQTQALSIVTLGPLSDEQKLDGLDEQKTKRYIHQYNFPSYSVGETRPSRGPGRREVGHGALAERALDAVIPSEDEFPYAIRVVSEILSSNGSTSQASICGSTLALMDAGVPIKTPVAGISCGLITDEDGSFMTMIDIQGLEDFFGDMDFKVGGTKKGITAIQVDIKNDGLSTEVIEEALKKTRDARIHIIDNIITPIISSPRDDVAEYAPKVEQMLIPVDKIRDVIGSYGKVVQKISADYDVKIDIDDDGHVYISGISRDNVNAAKDVIESIVNDPEVGEIYRGKVTKVMAFGAFVEIAPGKEGLVHISKLDFNRVNSVTDVVNEGDQIVVKVVEIDSQGRINLSRKDAIADLQKSYEPNDK